MADPRVPVGGCRPSRGANSQGGYVLKILYVETKESGPLGGGLCAEQAALDPPMGMNKIMVGTIVKQIFRSRMGNLMN